MSFQFKFHYIPFLFLFLASLCGDPQTLWAQTPSDVGTETNIDLGPTLDLGERIDLFRIDEILIKGNRKIESEAILNKIGARKGMMLDNYLLRSDLKALYSLNHFEFVEAHHLKRGEKNVLLWVTKERPIIKTITFDGNSEITREDLISKIKSKEFNILDTNQIKSDVKELQKFYEEKGFYLVAITHELKPIDEENLELIFHVKEYDKVRVKKVEILGNRVFKDEELKGLMQTREDSLFSFMNDAGNFKNFDFKVDIERLAYFYKTKGYLQVNIGTPYVTVSEDKRWIFITFRITEGPQFTVNDILFEGDLLFSDQDLNEKIKLKREEIYSEETLRQDILTLTEAYQDEGYAFANVLRTLQIVPGENRVDVHFSFEKGELAYFGRVFMKGNSKTRDKVLLREVSIKEGQKFSGSALRKSKENVNRLGFFEPESVIFQTLARKEKSNVLDVEISVKEHNTGQIQAGAGYSTAQKGFLQASVTERNFRGLGQELSFTVNHSSLSREYRIGFVEPYLFDSKWTAGGDIYQSKNKASRTYSSSEVGLDTRVGYPIWEYTQTYLTYNFSDSQITAKKKEGTNYQIDPTIDEALESGVTSSIETSFVIDRRNHRLEPSSGYYSKLAYEYAGIGGKHHWARNEWDGRFYYTVVGDLVLRTRLRVMKLYTVESHRIPKNRRFTLGGARDLRGYGFDDIGIYDSVTDENNQVITYNKGGEFASYANIEFEHPLVREAGLKWVVFFDAGNVYQKYIGEEGNYALRADWGFGFRWFSPIGPLRFEFGHPISKRNEEQSRQFYFDIGQVF